MVINWWPFFYQQCLNAMKSSDNKLGNMCLRNIYSDTV